MRFLKHNIVLILIATLNCTTTHLINPNIESYQTLNSKFQNKKGIVTLQNGYQTEVYNITMSDETVTFINSITGKREAYQLCEIRDVTTLDKDKGARQGMLIMGLIGGTIGGIYGYALGYGLAENGDAHENALEPAMKGSVFGAGLAAFIIGLPIGATKGAKERDMFYTPIDSVSVIQ